MENYKNTKQRELILKEIKKLKNHPTAEYIYEILREKDPTIGLCTVYRNLEKFASMGLIKKISGKTSKYDPTITNHHHIVCKICGKIEDIDFTIDDKKIEEMGYKLDSIKINAICKNCKKEEL